MLETWEGMQGMLYGYWEDGRDVGNGNLTLFMVKLEGMLGGTSKINVGRDVV